MGVTGARHRLEGEDQGRRQDPDQHRRRHARTAPGTRTWASSSRSSRPNDPRKPAGVDVFTDKVKLDRGCPNDPDTARSLDAEGWRPKACTPNLTGAHKTLCLRGGVTHGPVAGERSTTAAARQVPGAAEGEAAREITDVTVGGFTYGLADLGVVGLNGIPRVKAGRRCGS